MGAFQRAGRGGAGIAPEPHSEVPPQGNLVSGSTLRPHLKGSLFPQRNLCSVPHLFGAEVPSALIKGPSPSPRLQHRPSAPRASK